MRKVCLRDNPDRCVIIDFYENQEQLVRQITYICMNQHFEYGQCRVFAGIEGMCTNRIPASAYEPGTGSREVGSTCTGGYDPVIQHDRIR